MAKVHVHIDVYNSIQVNTHEYKFCTLRVSWYLKNAPNFAVQNTKHGEHMNSAKKIIFLFCLDVCRQTSLQGSLKFQTCDFRTWEGTYKSLGLNSKREPIVN